MYIREFVKIIENRMMEHHPLMQFVIGPRQVGKTTGVEMFLKKYKGPVIYELVEGDLNQNQSWLRLQWQKAISLGNDSLLVIDEIQKIDNWAEVIKSLWDSGRKKKLTLKCIFLGSSSLTLQKGLTESLLGRYELIQVFHWSYSESKKICKNLSFDQYCRLGGYPKSYDFLSDAKRVSSYIRESIVRNAIEKDILLNHTIKKPGLFKQTAEILAAYPSKEVSYTKLLGQLQEGGNVELIKHYLSLFEGTFLFKAIPKFVGVKSKLSSPKILVLGQALIYALCPVEIDKGYLFENLVGAELLKWVDELFYWREGDYEVDFVARVNKTLYAIEVKSGRSKHSKSLNVFLAKYKNIKHLIIDESEYNRLCVERDKFFN